MNFILFFYFFLIMEFKFVHEGCTYYKVKQTKTNLQNYFHPSLNHHYTRFFLSRRLLARSWRASQPETTISRKEAQQFTQVVGGLFWRSKSNQSQLASLQFLQS